MSDMKTSKATKNARTRFAFQPPFKCRFCDRTDPHGHRLDSVMQKLVRANSMRLETP